MRPEQRSSPSLDLHCILCKRAEETKTTGPLSTKQDVAAHQNCLLYASGIFCKNSPTFDDLFGFDVEDVKNESKRGRKLKCTLCKQNGATAGCEVKSCKRSYHYPCSKEAHAIPEEDEEKGTFRLYCVKHNPHASNFDLEEGDANVNPSISACKRSETNEQSNSHGEFESDTDTPISRRSMNRKRKFLESFSDSDETPSINDELEDTPLKKDRQQTLDFDVRSSDNKEPVQGAAPNGSDDDEANGDTDIESQSLLLPEYRQENVPFTVIADSGPSIESKNSSGPSSPATPSPADTALSNLDQSFSAPEQAVDLHSNISIPPNPPVPARPSLDSPQSGTTGESSNVKEGSCGDLTARASQDIPPLEMNDELPGSHVKGLYHNPLDLTTPEVCHVDVSDSRAALFWRRCNEVGCTGSIFAELTGQLASLAEKVKNQHATQQDYAVSLRILEASGKLPAIFNHLEQDLEAQERQLQRKRVALRNAKAVVNLNYVK